MKEYTVHNGTNTGAQQAAFSDMPFCIASLYANRCWSSKNNANNKIRQYTWKPLS